MKFCETIRRYDATKNTLVSSTLQNNMDTFRRECPEVATSATTSETTAFYIFSKLHLVGLYRPKFSSLQVPDKSGGRQVMSGELSASARQWGLKIINWTIDTPEQATYFEQLGTDGINTSFPKRIINNAQ
jgi:glycerophosphoryl diester phosphodiesterase